MTGCKRVSRTRHPRFCRRGHSLFVCRSNVRNILLQALRPGAIEERFRTAKHKRTNP